MKYLCLISVVWAIAYSVPTHLAKQRELNIMEEKNKSDYKLKELQIKLDYNSLNFLRKLMEMNSSEPKKFS